ncbi:MAG: hypothetical protein BM485_04460 [Desulfobulbaceae bacterium DB1]|nr:MAG: hypothetical protein BM485_04460 [Desulfobulbaceae bacterium DB1]
MMELRNITKSYRDQRILADVSLEIREREMVSIMGKSGPGKSTLLAVMAGLVKPDSGQVLLCVSILFDFLIFILGAACFFLLFLAVSFFCFRRIKKIKPDEFAA